MPISLGIGTAVTRGGGLYGPPPQLDLNFASLLSLTPSVGPTPSFTRASTGTYFDASGVLTTAAINGPRFDHVYNGSSWVSKGLLVEEQRTNLALYSQNFTNIYWTKTAPVTLTAADRVAPDGTQTGTKVVFTAVNQEVYRSVGLSGTPYTISLWVYGTNGETITLFDGNTMVLTTLTGTWQRLVTTSSNTTHFDFGTFGGSTARTVWIWGAQVESGSFPTSYIPTTTAAATRSADVCQITGSDFTSFWNASEGSVAVSYDMTSTAIPSGSLQRIFSVWNSGFSSGFAFSDRDTTSGIESSAGGNFNFGVPVSPNTTAFAYKVNDFATSRNGGTVLTGSGAIFSSPSSMYIGNNNGTGLFVHNGHIARLRYFNTRLLNSQLVALSI